MSIEVAGDRLRLWRERPDIFVREVFNVTPDAWQQEALEAFPHTKRLCMKACAGPGKTAVLAWIGWNFLLTRPHPVVGCTSITGDNLGAGLWPELSRWYERSSLLTEAFQVTGKEIFNKQFPKTWRMQARTWARDANAEQIGSALAGLHASYVMWLLDETGDYPNAVMPVCEGIFNGDPIEAHICQAGNPTRMDGPLYRACSSARDLWYVVEITADPDDPKRTPRVSVEAAKNMIQQYGRDNPWVMVKIFGRFPSTAFNALIGPDEVSAAFRRVYTEHDFGGSAKVLGVDVARQGDDASVICRRQGLQVFKFDKYRGIDSATGASQVGRKMDEFGAHACFVDATGGHGWGWIDQMRLLGRSPLPVQFAGEARDKVRYYNKRAEMYFDAVEWIKSGGSLPEVPELLAALTQTTYTFKGDRLLLEPKEDVKTKLGYSPDEADAFVLTFAEPVIPPSANRALAARHVSDYNPYPSLVSQTHNNSYEYDPFK